MAHESEVAAAGRIRPIQRPVEEQLADALMVAHEEIPRLREAVDRIEAAAFVATGVAHRVDAALDALREASSTHFARSDAVLVRFTRLAESLERSVEALGGRVGTLEHARIRDRQESQHDLDDLAQLVEEATHPGVEPRDSDRVRAIAAEVEEERERARKLATLEASHRALASSKRRILEGIVLLIVAALVGAIMSRATHPTGSMSEPVPVTQPPHHGAT